MNKHCILVNHPSTTMCSIATGMQASLNALRNLEANNPSDTYRQATDILESLLEDHIKNCIIKDLLVTDMLKALVNAYAFVISTHPHQQGRTEILGALLTIINKAEATQ